VTTLGAPAPSAVNFSQILRVTQSQELQFVNTQPLKSRVIPGSHETARDPLHWQHVSTYR